MAFIDVSDINKQFPGAVVSRGKTYYNQGRVRNFREENGVITSQVQGSKNYRQQIILSGKHIKGGCSCPMGANCKHVVASLFEYVNNHQVGRPVANVNDSEVDIWLKSIESASAPQTKKKSNTVNKALFYTLRMSSEHAFTLEVITLTANILKSGRYSQINTYATDNVMRSGSRPKFMTSDDVSVLTLLSQRDSAFYSRYADSPIRLDRPEDGYLLTRLIETGRSKWGDIQKSPLAMGSQRNASLEWRINDNGSQTLALLCESKDMNVFFIGDDVYYHDPEKNIIGTLNTPAQGEILKKLITSPSVPAESVAKVRDALSKALKGIVDLPLPKAFKKKAGVQHVKPVPHLTLSKCVLTGKEFWIDDETTGGADLTFSYHDATTYFSEAGDVITKVDGESVYDIRRDKRFEGKCVDKLKSHHLSRLISDKQSTYNLPKTNGDLFIILGAPDEINTQESFDAWVEFMVEVVPELEEKGWKITVDPDFPYNISVADDEWYADVEESPGMDWFGLELGVTVNGEKINLAPLLLQALKKIPVLDHMTPEDFEDYDEDEQFYLPMGDNKMLALPAKRVGKMLFFIKELYGIRDEDDLDKPLRLSRNQALELAELEELQNALNMRRMGGDKIIELGKRLKTFSSIVPAQLPKGLNATLRDYQKEGVNWLQFLREYELAGVLADDMGLGKTIQILTHILCEKENGRLTKPALVIAPTSLMGNWAKEAAKFTPDLRVLVLHGSERKEDFDVVEQHDLVLTTYPLLPRDKDVLLQHSFHSVILDEAHYIKNPKSKINKIACMIKADHRICMTGTPVENHLGELWALFNFLMPGYLGDDKEFKKFYRKPIEKQSDVERNKTLVRRIKPFVLRRTKEQVVLELPPKTEMIRTAVLDKAQRDLYETIRVSMSKKVRDEIAKKGLARSHIIVLEALLKLRQVCCDPRLVKMEQAKAIEDSAKREMLLEMLPGLIEDGRKILLFSQFTGMLGLIEKDLAEMKIPYVKLTGQTKDRITPVNAFQEGDVPLFLISLKAGGVGLNLTAADTVIHYDPWWNPAAENQATDRAHRIGQEKPVFVYKLITEGTVEEKILEMQEKKRELAAGLFDPNGKTASKITGEDVAALFEAM